MFCLIVHSESIVGRIEYTPNQLIWVRGHARANEYTQAHTAKMVYFYSASAMHMIVTKYRTNIGDLRMYRGTLKENRKSWVVIGKSFLAGRMMDFIIKMSKKMHS